MKDLENEFTELSVEELEEKEQELAKKLRQAKEELAYKKENRIVKDKLLSNLGNLSKIEDINKKRKVVIHAIKQLSEYVPPEKMSNILEDLSKSLVNNLEPIDSDVFKLTIFENQISLSDKHYVLRYSWLSTSLVSKFPRNDSLNSDFTIKEALSLFSEDDFEQSLKKRFPRFIKLLEKKGRLDQLKQQ